MPSKDQTTETKESLRAEIAELEERVKRIERREKTLADLNTWLETNQLDHKDLVWLAKQTEEKTNGAHPPAAAVKTVAKARYTASKRKGDWGFQRRAMAKRIGKGWTPEQLAKRIGVSGSSIRFWEAGRAVPTERNRLKLVHVLGLPATAGAAATAAMEAALTAKG